MDVFFKILFLLLAYFVGSIPFGLLFSKIKGVDIRKVNSGNIGATNVGRALGPKYAVLTFIGDMLKGALFVALFRYNVIPENYMVLSPALYGICAIIGHAFPIYLKFKGGKCVATSSGAVFAYIPLLFPIAVVCYFVTFIISEYSSLGSLVGAFILAVISVIFTLVLKVDPITKIDIDIYYLVLVGFGLTIIVLKHIPNIKRLIHHEEHKINVRHRKNINKDSEESNIENEKGAN